MKGKIAFELVLEKLIEAVSKNGTNDGELMEARRRFSVRDEVVKILEDQVKVLQEDATKAAPKLKELWDASDNLIKGLGVGSSLTSDQKRLRAALEASSEFCGYPF